MYAFSCDVSGLLVSMSGLLASIISSCHCDSVIEARKPDLVVLDKMEHRGISLKIFKDHL